MTCQKMMAAVTLSDFSNELCSTGALTRSCSPRERARMIDEAIGLGFVAFRGRQSRFVTYTLGSVGGGCNVAWSLTFDLQDRKVELQKSELTALGRAE